MEIHGHCGLQRKHPGATVAVEDLPRNSPGLVPGQVVRHRKVFALPENVENVAARAACWVWLNVKCWSGKMLEW